MGKSIFNCSQCSSDIDLFKIKTKKQIDDLHEKHLCPKCSDKEKIIAQPTIIRKRRKKNDLQNLKKIINKKIKFTKGE